LPRHCDCVVGERNKTGVAFDEFRHTRGLNMVSKATSYGLLTRRRELQDESNMIKHDGRRKQLTCNLKITLFRFIAR
jgi:hypothetical protein